MFKYVCEAQRKFYKVQIIIRFMMLDKKKGLSPIIATILLISLAMILAAIIFLWARGWIFEQIEKKGAPIDQVCGSVVIAVDHERKGNDVILWISNRGTVYISSIEVRQEGSDSSNLNSWSVGIAPGSSGNVTIRLEDNPDTLIVYPQLIGSVRGGTENRATTCLESGKTIKL